MNDTITIEYKNCVPLLKELIRLSKEGWIVVSVTDKIVGKDKILKYVYEKTQTR